MSKNQSTKKLKTGSNSQHAEKRNVKTQITSSLDPDKKRQTINIKAIQVNKPAIDNEQVSVELKDKQGNSKAKQTKNQCEEVANKESLEEVNQPVV